MARLRLPVILAATLSLALLVPASAHTWADVAPNSQSHAYGVQSNWTVSYDGTGLAKIVFCYGDGGCVEVNTNANSRNFNHTFFPCNTTNYTQWAYVHRPIGVHILAASATAQEAGGPFC